MGEPLWRQCVDWLDRFKILRKDQFPPDSQVVNFGQCIRDGVLLCHLITKLDGSALDFRDVCQRTQMSQYMSLKNIRLFLRACKKFDLLESDLFEPAMLFDYTDFGRVLRCLSKLSKCPKVAALGVDGFPINNGRHFSEDEDIYKRLEDIEQGDHQPIDYCYAPADENIYEDLCSLNRDTNQGIPTLLQAPADRRDFSISELIVTEKNYIDALCMIKLKFLRPLNGFLSEEEKQTIFFGIEKLIEIHSAFYNDLLKACNPNSGLAIHAVFLNFKAKFCLYGEVCSNLPNAQHAIETAIGRSRVVADEIERCQRDANRGAYLNLKDLITLPMQRVLKYPLLLKNLASHTDSTHGDHPGICLASEAMKDVAEYINESKRDFEMQQVISDVQASIADWNTMEHGSLAEYGRLVKDGELKIRSHEESRNAKLRYAFLFNRGVIFCKSTRGDQYSFRLFLPLHKYKLEDYQTMRSQNGRQESRWTHQFLLVDNHNKTAYTLYTKSPDSKMKWMRAFSEAIEALYPQESRGTDHNYILHTFSNATAENCDLCKKLFKGTFFQGYKCTKCCLSAHKTCLGVVKGCGVPIPPPRPMSVTRSSTAPSNPELENFPWYAGEMTRIAAEAALRNTPVGTYLLRFKSNENSYALSLKTGEEIKHMKVVQSGENGFGGRSVQFFLSESFPFRTLVDLVTRYTHNSLRESFKGLDAFLEVPWKHFYHTAVVIEDYYAEDLNLLSIMKGCHIVIVSKEGDATGWWKGRFNDQEGYFPKEYVREDHFYQGI